MDLLYIYLTYNRPKVLSDCLRTSLNYANPKPTECYVLDDGSEIGTQRAILQFAQENRNVIPINCVLQQKNYGIGWAFENCFNIIKWKSPVVVGILESDYIFRQEYLEDIMAVFEANPYIVEVIGTDHPDTFDRYKTHTLFPELMKEQFLEDVKGREYMYKPFDLLTKRGNIKLQGVSNSCGACFMHWERFTNMLKDIGREQDYWSWMDRAFNKQENGNRKHASDQHMSCSVSFFWEEWALKNGVDISKNFGMVSITDVSISQHLCCGGINGMIPGMKEGETFVISPKWTGETFNREQFNKLNP